MPKYTGVSHLSAVKALEREGFRVARQGKHIVMTNGTRVVTVPRHNPINAITMGKIIRDARGARGQILTYASAPSRLARAPQARTPAGRTKQGIPDIVKAFGSFGCEQVKSRLLP